ncbi:MAG: glycoside hydrolase family 2 protein [Ignavibacteria bacterium]|nr:glycoside hydrolase family 2 protein [Ignavibacteria bacterium]
MKYLLTLILIVFTTSIYPQELMLQKINSNWKFKSTSKETWINASVPGTVHTDLMYYGMISDVYFGANEKDVQWIENETWEYKSEFFVPDELLNKKNIKLVFEGLDTYSEIYFNGELILKTDNAFRRYECDVKNNIKQQNELSVKFFPVSETEKRKREKYNFELPGGSRVFTRKPAYHYGWDWGGRFVTCGIWKDVYLKASDFAEINDMHYNYSLDEKGNAAVKIFYSLDCFEEGEYEIQMKNANTNDIKSEKINLKSGLNENYFEYNFTPDLWWTNGLGQPNLYRFEFKIIKEGNVIDEKVNRIGFRKIELIKEKDKYGESFYFKLNGIPVFMKGANVVPLDNFIPRVDDNRYGALIKQCVESNMNMLRVWGGGIYENDVFYDLCDENGILVWQDFMFACGMYPYDTEFLNNVKEEIKQQIIRLRNHSCVALWCGNNEIDEGWKNWGWQKEFKFSEKDSAEIWNGYVELFENIIPELISENYLRNEGDVNKYYVPTSPKHGWGREESMKEGDSHYWGVWWGEEPFEMYAEKTGRFMSEYGFQAMPQINSFLKFLDSRDLFLYSDALKNHQKADGGFDKINQYLKEYFFVPLTFEDYNYMSQLAQMYGISKAIESHRINKPRCMGTLYWQLNDCWPVISWSGFDYYGNKKALQYAVKELYRDVMLGFINENNNLKVYVVSDRMKMLNGKLIIDVFSLSGKSLKNISTDVSVPPNESKMVYELKNEFKELRDVVVKAVFTGSEGQTYKKDYYYVPPKRLILPQAEYTHSLTDNSITIKAKTFIKHMELRFKDIDVIFSDNYFDLMPGEEKTVFYDMKGKQRGAKPQLLIKNLNDLFYARN